MKEKDVLDYIEACHKWHSLLPDEKEGLRELPVVPMLEETWEIDSDGMFWHTGDEHISGDIYHLEEVTLVADVYDASEYQALYVFSNSKRRDPSTT